MCGIIGATKTSEEAVRAALDTFAYRGPDARKYYIDQGVALGHARLSVIDLDARADQPFQSQDKELIVVFNGEIYNFQELRKELEARSGTTFTTTSDTEVLLMGYAVWGAALLPKLRGMFAFAIYDKRTNSVFLARDHAGIKPLYISEAGGRLLFASELKGVVALVRENGGTVTRDTEALALYSVLGYLPSPLTVVQEVKKLERGTWARYDLSTNILVHERWEPATEKITSVDELERAIKRSVLEHCIADVPVGAFFSGGVDSSLIVALLHEAGMAQETFSVRVQGREADEPYFRAIAETLGVTAQVADFGVEEFDQLYEELLTRIDDPIADTSIFPTAFVARLASQHVKVVLSGEGGDELFLGYPRALQLARMRRYRTARLFDAVFHGLPSFQGKTRLFSKVAYWRGLPAQYYLLATSPARDQSKQSAWQRAVQLLEQSTPAWFDRDFYLENMLLRKTDMATSYASIEGRVPLLGVSLWNNAPHFMQENLKDGKTILKNMLARHIPRTLIDRPKAGFGLDITSLFNASVPLQADLRAAILALEELGILDTHETERQLIAQYPVYGFGLVVLYRALQNLDLLEPERDTLQ